jgi:outer membrane protein assembly complex protein YaeT
VLLRSIERNFCLLAFSIAGWAQNASFEALPIAAIQYAPSSVLSDSDLARIQPLKVGDPLRSEDVASAIDALFATGEFENVRVEAERSGSGVIVRFVTAPTRYIASLTIDGKVADPPNRGELASLPRLTRGNVFRESDLAQAVAAIQKILVANGLYEARVTPDVKADPGGQQMFLSLTIQSGKRARYEMPVVHGDTSLSLDTIVRATGWRMRFIGRWRQVTQARSRNGLSGILKKYESQDRLKARVEMEELKYDPDTRRVTPTLNLERGPQVKVTATEAKVSQRVLKRYVPVFQERTVDNDLLAEGARNLRDYFQSKGYFDAVVDFRTVMPDNDLETVQYAISQGLRYKLVHVAVTGNKYFDEDTIRERMFLEPASFHLRHGRYSEAFRRKDEENVANLYRANGFRDVKVTSEPVASYGGHSDQIGVTIHIEEGSQWLVDGITLDGIADNDREKIQGGLATAAGQPFSDVSMAADRNSILTYYSTHGFPSAEFKAGWQPGDAPHHVNVIYTIAPGQQQFVRKILITGLRQTGRKLVDQQMTLHDGDPLSGVEQRNIQKRLYDLGVFARVDTAIENPDGDTSSKNLLYAFDEANRYSVTTGVGAQIGRFGTPSDTSLTSAGGATGFSPLFSINASRLNFLGLGHTISVRGVYSSLQKRASASYFLPRFQNAAGRSLTFSILYDQTLDVRTFSSKRQEASVQLSQRFSRSTTGLFRIAYRRVTAEDVVIPVLLIPQLLQSVRLGIVSANISRDRRDNSADPHRGSYNTADFSLAARYLGSERNFGRLLLRNATYYRLTKDIVLARQTEFGVIESFTTPPGVSAGNAIPLPERFFGGGPDSLRAFPFNQAGPRDTGAPVVPGGPSSQPTGFPLGGNALVFNNVELRFPLIGENIQGVLFHDMGNVYGSLNDISFRFHQRNDTDFNYAVHAAGFGLRYRTPVGPIRADLAYSINPPAYQGFSGTTAELINCGPNGSTLPNCQSTGQRISHFQFFFSIGQTF